MMYVQCQYNVNSVLYHHVSEKYMKEFLVSNIYNMLVLVVFKKL